MQFADFGASNQTKASAAEEEEIDAVHFLKFLMLNEKLQEENTSEVQLEFPGENGEKSFQMEEAKNKKKSPRTTKTSEEETESQRMTQIAVERNPRKQMNEHFRILRSLMPGSYVQRVWIYSKISLN